MKDLLARLGGAWKKIWFVLWKDDSPMSIIISFIVAYLLIQFVFYPGLGLLLGTEYPVVAVISGSMEHRATLGCTEYENIAGDRARNRCAPNALVPMICGTQVNETGRLSFDEYWSLCGSWYEDESIAKGAFVNFPFPRGFDTGDIMILRAPENIQIGDVIVFEGRTPEPIIHRVIDIRRTDRGTVYSTKGDHNAGQIISYQQMTLGEGSINVAIIDERSINEAQVVGKAWARIPWLGYPKLWLTQIITAVR